MTEKPRSNFLVIKHDNGIAFIVDANLGGMSVTNDAERVTAYMYPHFGNSRIVYRDISGTWDEIVHEDGVFKHFAPFHGEVPKTE